MKSLPSGDLSSLSRRAAASRKEMVNCSSLNIPKPRVAAANLFADMTEALYIAL